MNKKKKKIIRISIILAVIVAVAIVIFISYGNRKVGAKQFTVENNDEMDFNPFMSTENRLDNSLLEYGKVLTKYGQKGYTDYTGEDIVVDMTSLTGTEGGSIVRLTEYENYDGGIKYYDNNSESTVTVDCSQFPNAIYTDADGCYVTFNIDVPVSGLYSLNLDYLMIQAKDAEMYVGIMIDNKLPFKNASNMALKRMYGFYNTEIEKNLDISGNQIRPKSQELLGWQNVTMSNPEGVYKNEYKMYMKQGVRKITMHFYNQPGAIGAIRFTAPKKFVTYDQYVAANGGAGNTYSGNVIRFELENADYTSSVSIRMEYDNDYRSSPASFKVTRYNVFGGERWNTGGDTVQWSFEVPEDGWYQLGIRYMSITTNVASYKDIKIDGEIPFSEMNEYCFPYADGWIGDALKNDKNEPYMFYFTKGTHTLTMVNKIGPLRHSYYLIEEAMDSITSMINQVAKITSSTRSSSGGYVVDRNRDWDLEKNIPDLQDDLDKYVALFDRCYTDISVCNGGKQPSYGSAVKVALELFKKMADDMEKVPISLNDINSALTGLSNTMVAIREQAITVDYMELSEKGYNYKNSRSNSWQNMYVGFVRFKDTFIKDYSSVGQREKTKKDMVTLEVYVSRGREYVDILRNLISEQFTPDYDVRINVNMVNGSEGLIMTRYVAGTAPDLAIAIGAGIPFEFSVRGALLPLDKFDKSYTLDNGTQVLSFQDLVAQSFYEEELIPYLYQGHYYGFPETQNWAALFYRTDILEELDVEPPDTWEDVYNLVPVLTKDGYSFYFPYGVGNYTPFLYQHGGTFYDEDGLASRLNTEAAYDAFVEYADLYLQYNFVYAADFYMRFKNGEMPVGIGDMGFYCKLKYSAPELNGKWQILPVPGHTVMNDEGEVVVDRSNGGAGSCNIIISSTKHPDEAWQFIQWWMSDSVQSEYGREVEATFGVASRWNPANKNAVATLPYTQYELSVIYDQWSWLKESPSTLGGYYTSRYLITALNQTVLQGKNARVALEDAVKEINKEMKRKQKEYKVPEGGSVLREVVTP
ncbi:MAG: extracellular solute-binding protein [Clostridia bacterium]|nr:extracellular solute-binding protein [Clostridia bacterium]